MRKNIFKTIILIFIIPFISIGVATWILSGVNRNSNSINHTLTDSGTVEVNVHYRTQSSEKSTITEYFIPKTFTVSHNLSYTDKSGNKSYDKITSSDVKVSNDDSLLVYYDVNNGTYTKIDQRNQAKGPEQIKSFSANITEWQQVNSANEYGNIWDVTVDHPDKSNYRLRFEQDSGNELTGGHGYKYNIGDIYQDDVLIYSNVEEIDNKIITTNIYQRIIVDKQEKIVFGKKLYIINYSKWVYYTTFQQRMIKITQITGENEDHEDNIKTITVKKNSHLSVFDLGIPDYKRYGFYSDSNYETYFDFSKPITESQDIYLRYIKSSTGIANLINNSSNATINLYDPYLGGSGGTLDLSTDPTYHNKTNSVFVDPFTIDSNVNLNLTYSTALSYIEPCTGTVPQTSLAAHRNTLDNAIAQDYDADTYIGDSNASCHLKLNGNITIKGKMTIGGEIGGYNATSFYSFIIGKYGILDLHGNTIIIDGGTLISYGLIKDSVGGGKIIVKNGGSLTSVLTISDGRGRDPSALGIAKRQAPFTEYKFSYLQVPVQFYNGTTFNGYLKADFADMGIVNLIIPVLGNTFNSYLFSWGTNTSIDYTLYEPYQIEEFSVPSNTIQYKNMYQWRNRFSFSANVREASTLVVSATVDSTMGEVEIKIDFARIDVPISPFFDIILNAGYSMEINSKMTLYPGSYFYVSKDSMLNFKYLGEKKYDEISAKALGMGITIPGETRYIAGGIMTYTNRIQDLAVNGYSTFGVGIYNIPTYWNYVKESHVVIDGSITFDSGINTAVSDGYYYLSGNIALSNDSLNNLINSRNYVKTYDFKTEIRTAFLYNSQNYSLDKQYSLATSYNINPIISGESAYFIDKDNLIFGNYDKSNGILTDTTNTKKYFLKTDNDMYENGSSGSDQDSRVDRNISLVEVKNVYSDYKIITDLTNSNYLYYCGLYVPLLSDLPEIISFANNSEVNINARKFMSNSNGPLTVNLRTITVNEDGTKTTSDAVVTNICSCFSNVTVRYSTSTKQWKFYCYGQYPKTANNTKYYTY